MLHSILNILTRNLLYITIAACLSIKVLGGMFMPLTNDEAYYFFWTKILDMGYFDHPPMIAWLMALGGFTDLPFAARLGSIVLAILSWPIFYSLMTKVSPRANPWCQLMFHGSLFGLLFGVIATPDVPMVFFWLCALHEAAAAISGQKKRWLSAGLCTGLGFLGKYTMVLILPVFLWVLIRNKAQRLSIWPYLGALVAILTITPHLIWNAENDWISLRFQFNRGLKHSHHVQSVFSPHLPHASFSKSDPQGLALAQKFVRKAKPTKPKKEKSAWQKAQRRISNYWSGQAGVWGLLIIFWLLALRLTSKPSTRPGEHQHQIYDIQKPLLYSATLVPLCFFGIIALFQKVEANWPAPYLISASLLAGPYLRHPRLLAGLSWLHISVCLVIFCHSIQPILTAKPHKDRILQETHGFLELAAQLSSEHPIYTETYQLAGKLQAYKPEATVSQWPGLTRHSEITRRQAFSPYSFQDLQNFSRFQLVSLKMKPPLIKGFQVVRMRQFIDCLDGLIIRESKADLETDVCENPIHIWYAHDYKSIF